MCKYKELYQTFSLKEIIQEPTRITSTTSCLLDHILTNAGWKISQKGVIDVGLSDHQLIYCKRKILRTKANMHNQIRVQSLKKYTTKLLIKELKKINFPKYNIFSNVNIAYLDPVEKVLRIKNNTQEWFDDEVAKAIKLMENRLKQFKSTKLHIDEDLYKEAKYHAVKLIKQKQCHFYKEKLKENIGKSKELWKALKSLGLPSKKGTISNICLKKDDKICFDDKTNANTFKKLFCNLASDLVAKLPPPSKRFGLDTARSYYQDILGLLPSRFKFSNVTEYHVLQLLKDMNVDKTAGIDNLSGKFLKDGANILAKPLNYVIFR